LTAEPAQRARVERIAELLAGLEDDGGNDENAENDEENAEKHPLEEAAPITV